MCLLHILLASNMEFYFTNNKINLSSEHLIFLPSGSEKVREWGINHVYKGVFKVGFKLGSTFIKFLWSSEYRLTHTY